MKPNLFLVGAPKTGSTSLYHYLAENPNIFMSRDKEPHYFCDDFHKQCTDHHGELIKFCYTSIDQYESLFSSAGGYSVIGEASTTYLYSESAARNIYEYNPDAKIIAILRNPVQLLHSWYNYISYTSEEPSSTFEQALSLESERKNDWGLIPKSVWFPTRVFYRELVRFDDQLLRYYDLFDDSNVKVIVLEDLAENPLEVYNEILRFLDVEPHLPNFKAHNAYQEIRFRKLKWFIDNHLGELKSYVRNHRGTKLANTMETIYKLTMGRNAERPAINTALHNELVEELFPMVVRTEKLVNRDLRKIWGLTSL